MVISGSGSVPPSRRAASPMAATRSLTSSSGSSDMRPAMERGTAARTSPSATTAWPPPVSATARAAASISASEAPTTTMLWLSWATVEAMAPRCRPKPRTKPTPRLPLPRWRSITAILSRSRAGSATAWPFSTRSFSTDWPVTIWPGTAWMTRARPSPAAGTARPNPSHFTRTPLPGGAGGLGRGPTYSPSSATTRPATQT